ncbi:MAG: hydrogenase maturation protease [Nostocoides sp.]
MNNGILVLGVGNPIMGDDQVGLAILAGLQQARPDAPVQFVDGGTGGLELLPLVEDCGRLLVLDAVAGQVPGQVVAVSGDQVPRLLASKLSPHQVGLLDIFTAARLRGREPHRVEVVGVVPQSVELRVGLSEPVAAAVGAAVVAAADVLDDWIAEPPELVPYS